MGDPGNNPTEQSGARQQVRPAPESEPQCNGYEPMANRNPIWQDQDNWQNQDKVIVRELPAELNSDQGRIFFCEIQKLIAASHRRFVFDCAQVRELDAGGIHLLLRCLEEAMKLNGDIKLAAVPAGPVATLEATGVDRLFEVFESAADAVQSFFYLPLPTCPMEVTLNTTDASAAEPTIVYGAD